MRSTIILAALTRLQGSGPVASPQLQTPQTNIYLATLLSFRSLSLFSFFHKYDRPLHTPILYQPQRPVALSLLIRTTLIQNSTSTRCNHLSLNTQL